MRLNTRLLLFCLLFPPTVTAMLLAPTALRAQQTPAKKDVQALYDRFAVSIRSKDIKAMGNLMAPDMVNKDKSGKNAVAGRRAQDHAAGAQRGDKDTGRHVHGGQNRDAE